MLGQMSGVLHQLNGRREHETWKGSWRACAATPYRHTHTLQEINKAEMFKEKDYKESKRIKIRSISRQSRLLRRRGKVSEPSTADICSLVQSWPATGDLLFFLQTHNIFMAFEWARVIEF